MFVFSEVVYSSHKSSDLPKATQKGQEGTGLLFKGVSKCLVWPWKRRELWKGVFGQGQPTSPRSPGSGLEWGCITGRLRWFAHCPDTDWWTSVLTAHLPVQMAPQTGSTEKGTQPVSAFLQHFTWEEIRSHNGRGQSQEQWLVIDRKVYDVSKFSKHHPGGSRVISHYAGQDATVRSRRLVEEGGSIGRAGWHGGERWW